MSRFTSVDFILFCWYNTAYILLQWISWKFGFGFLLQKESTAFQLSQFSYWCFSHAATVMETAISFQSWQCLAWTFRFFHCSRPKSKCKQQARLRNWGIQIFGICKSQTQCSKAQMTTLPKTSIISAILTSRVLESKSLEFKAGWTALVWIPGSHSPTLLR